MDLRLIGAGGFSKVYTAFDERFARLVALKVITVELGDDALRRFARERQITGQLDGHPHVIRVYDTGVTRDGRPFLAMEYLEQGSLADRVRRHGPLPLDEVLAIGVRLACALDVAHRRGIVHRDVKPQNVLLSPFVGPVLADFGIAAVDDARLTTATSEAFSVLHAAPEVLEGHSATPAADLYSLASTLYELLAGRAPYADTADPGLLALMRRVREQPVPPLGRPGVPAEVERDLQGMLARDPSARPASALALAESLQGVQARLGLAVTPLVAAGGTADARSAELAAQWGRPERSAASDRWAPAAADALAAPPPIPPPASPPATAPDGPLDHTLPPAARQAARAEAHGEPRRERAMTPGWPGTPPVAESEPDGPRAPPPRPPPPAPAWPGAGGDAAPSTDTIVRARPAPSAPEVADDDARRGRRRLLVGVAVALVVAVGTGVTLSGDDGEEEAAPATSTTGTTLIDPARIPACIAPPPDLDAATENVTLVPSVPPTGVALELTGDGSTAIIRWDDTNGGTAVYAVFQLCGEPTVAPPSSGTDEDPPTAAERLVEQARPVAFVRPGAPTEAVLQGLIITEVYCFGVAAVGPEGRSAVGTSADGRQFVCLDDPGT
jgi:hypothetical protein